MNFCGKLAGILMRNSIEKKGNSRQNMVVSPLGFNIILNMMGEGIAGPMSGQMLDLLDLKKKGAHHRIPSRLEEMSRDNEKQRRLLGKIYGPEDENPRSTVKSVTKALCEKTCPLPSNFHRLITQVYKGQLKEVDFINGNHCSIADEINYWAKKQTGGVLGNIISKDDLDASTELLLVNAIYFRGIWSSGFCPSFTTDRRFQLLDDGCCVSVPFMSGCNDYYHSSSVDDDFDVIRIPYGLPGIDDKIPAYEYPGDVCMYMFVPTEIHKFQTMLDKINYDGAFLSQEFELDKSRFRDSIWIPKFNMRYHTKDILRVLADFCSTKTPLLDYACKISQHSVIEVDELGTVAASGTWMEMYASARPGEEEKKEIVVDKPFVFMIRDEKSKLIIFLGMVLDPSLSLPAM